MKNRVSLSVGLLALVLATLTLVVLAFPVDAAPLRQGDENLPTPTLFPVENVPYTLEVVGGVQETFTVTYEDRDAFTLGETTFYSQYPAGMVFTVSPSSSNGAISEVILFIKMPHGTGNRFSAAWDEAQHAWIARPWDTGGQPAWLAFDFWWYIRDEAGVSIETGSNHAIYADPANEWFRSESDYLVLYWRGFGEDDPDAIAQRMANEMAEVEPRKIAGFGARISYKPTATIYPDREALSGMYASDISNSRAAGFTSSEYGASIQVLRHAGYAPNQEECVWAIAPEEWTMERRINTIFTVTTHEVSHLYQYDVLGGPFGPEWWTEGTAEWFASAPGLYDRRLRNLATLQDLPSLTTSIGSDMNQADGCYALSYAVGASFINWLDANYGIEVIYKALQSARSGVSLYDTIAQETGKTFLEVENEWRAYLGFRALTPADLDPSLALQPYEDPLIAVGDMITLPALPAISSLFQDPKPRAIMSGSCFANTEVEVLAMGELDGVAYFQVNCMGMIGWVTRDQLVGAQ